jgi:hypothetical protein
MMNALIGLGLGIIIFALIIGTGLVVLAGFGKATANCPTGYDYNTNGSTTFTDNNCCLTGGTTCSTEGNYTSASYGTQSTNTVTGYIQTNLVTWIPAIIALGIGLLFIGALMGKRKNY